MYFALSFLQINQMPVSFIINGYLHMVRHDNLLNINRFPGSYWVFSQAEIVEASELSQEDVMNAIVF